MSNKPRKCPSCGAQIQQGMRFCGKCGFDTQPQRPRPQGNKPGPQERTQGLPQPGLTAQEPPRPAAQEPPLTMGTDPTLPPQEPQPPMEADPALPPQEPQPRTPLTPPAQQKKRQQPKKPQPKKPEPKSPEQKKPEQEPMLPKPVRAQQPPLRAPHERQAHAPTSTARRPERPSVSDEDRRSTVRLIVMVVVIALIVAAAIILVIQMNQQDSPGEVQVQSETFEPVHVISADEPTPTPEPTPAPTPTPETTEAPEPTQVVEPTEAPSSMTEADDTVYVSGAGVNLRTGPSTTYSVAATLARGTELHRTGTTENWTRVEYNGGTYYISSSLITTERPEVTATATPEPTAYTVTEASGTVVVTSAVNVRSGPGTGYSILEVAQPNTELTRTGTVGSSWTRVSVNGTEGFVYNTYIQDKTDAAPAGDKAGTVTIVSRANIRAGAGTGYSVLGIAEVGESFDYYSFNGYWYQISYKDQTGYVFHTLVSAAAAQ